MTVVGIIGIIICTMIVSLMIFGAGFILGAIMDEEDSKLNEKIKQGQKNEYERLVNKLDIIENRVGLTETRLDMLDNDKTFK